MALAGPIQGMMLPTAVRQQKGRSLMMRLQKVIADAGVCSRRKAEDLITEGRVKVNGELCDMLGTKVDPEQDVVEVDGKIVDPMTVSKTYLVMHKPRGVVTTVTDPQGRPTVMDLCNGVPQRVFPVGRLDFLSEGLLLLTNDGEFSHRLMHPSFEVTKVYEVKVFGLVDNELLTKLRKGVREGGELLKPKSVRLINKLMNKTWLEFRLTGGRNREIRRLCEACGLTVDKLKRVAIGGLGVEGIAPGKFRYFTKVELDKLIGTHEEVEYVSQKRTVQPHKFMALKRRRRADHESFEGYRKEKYYETLEREKQMREIRLQKERETGEKQRDPNRPARPSGPRSSSRGTMGRSSSRRSSSGRKPAQRGQRYSR